MLSSVDYLTKNIFLCLMGFSLNNSTIFCYNKFNIYKTKKRKENSAYLTYFEIINICWTRINQKVKILVHHKVRKS